MECLSTTIAEDSTGDELTPLKPGCSAPTTCSSSSGKLETLVEAPAASSDCEEDDADHHDLDDHEDEHEDDEACGDAPSHPETEEEIRFLKAIQSDTEPDVRCSLSL